MKLCQSTVVVALLASSSVASGRSRNARVSKLASRSPGGIFPPPGFAFGGRVKESMAKSATSHTGTQRRTQEISDACWDESGELSEGDAFDELQAAVDECEIDDDTGSMYCSESADLEAACASGGGQAVYFDFSFECTDDLGLFVVEYEKFPDCIALSCDDKDIMGTAENWAVVEIEDFYSDISCGNIIVTGAETAETADTMVEEVDVPEEEAEGPVATEPAKEEEDSAKDESATDKDLADAEDQAPDEEKDPAETETEMTTEEQDPAETETEEPSKDMDEDKMMDADPVPDDTAQTDCYDETDAMNSSGEMLQEVSSALQSCEPIFGEDFVTVNCGATPGLADLCEELGGRVLELDLEYMCSNPDMGFDRTIPVSYNEYPLCSLCGSETDGDFETALEGIVLEDFLKPQGFVCDIADSGDVGAMASDTSTGSATSAAYMAIFPMVVVTIGLNILSF